MLGAALRHVVSDTVRRTVMWVAAGAAAAILFLIALGYVSLALYSWLLTQTTAPLAALGTAAVAILIALIVLAVVRLAVPSRRSRGDGLEQEISQLLGENIPQSVRASLKRHGGELTLAALLAGFAIGASPRLRKVLRSLLGF